MIDLEMEFKKEIKRLEKAIVLAPFEDRDFYCQWMNQHYFLVQHSTRYLTYCASQVDVNDEREFRWWVHHLEEEIGHDRVLLNDLKAFDVTALVDAYPETKSILATQYYDIEKNGPDALLGYALLLEGLSCEVCDSMAERIENSLGNRGTKFLRMHGSVDQDHFPEGIARIKDISEERKQVIFENLKTSSALYENLLNRLIQNTQKQQGVEIQVA